MKSISCRVSEKDEIKLNSISECKKIIFKIFRLFAASTLLIASLVFISSSVSVKNSESLAVKKQYYDSIIWPVVIHNPSPFNEENPPSAKLMLDSAVWHSAMNAKKNYYESNDDFTLILSEEEVKNSVKLLFGSKTDTNSLHMEDSYFYKFYPSQKKFELMPVDAVDQFLPRTRNFKYVSGGVSLQVEYVIPSERFNSKMDDFDLNQKAEKTMIYNLKKDELTKTLYISSVENI